MIMKIKEIFQKPGLYIAAGALAFYTALVGAAAYSEKNEKPVQAEVLKEFRMHIGNTPPVRIESKDPDKGTLAYLVRNEFGNVGVVTPGRGDIADPGDTIEYISPPFQFCATLDVNYKGEKVRTAHLQVHDVKKVNAEKEPSYK